MSPPLSDEQTHAQLHHSAVELAEKFREDNKRSMLNAVSGVSLCVCPCMHAWCVCVRFCVVTHAWLRVGMPPGLLLGRLPSHSLTISMLHTCF